MVKTSSAILNEFGAQTPKVYRSIEVLISLAISGLNVACVAYFWITDWCQLEKWSDRAAGKSNLFLLYLAGQFTTCVHYGPLRGAWVGNN